MRAPFAYTLHLLTPQGHADFQSLVHLFADVFEIENFVPPPEAHLRKVLSQEDFMVMVAKFGGKVIGGLTVHVLEQYYSERPLAYIYDLAVDTSCQRMGVGQKLMASIQEECQKRGFEEVFVQVERVDQQAVDFYRSTQPTQEEEVLQYGYTLLNSSTAAPT